MGVTDWDLKTASSPEFTVYKSDSEDLQMQAGHQNRIRTCAARRGGRGTGDRLSVPLEDCACNSREGSPL